MLVPVDIEKWSKDSIIISDPDVLVSPFDILRIEQFGFPPHLFFEQKVKSKKATAYGTIKDFTLDTTSSSLLSEVLKRDSFGLLGASEFSLGQTFSKSQNPQSF